ncbi:choline/ethanolaminephosphotransferase, putative [Plasmodium malariae]|uniref:Choline/ethanolaminephosphotransferase, putative n=1 Tax=Plasmodium malariae TaxID=5858 RepID=A0A1D3SMQ1_PLAMA|nr:choline/ethanolaminephosphotransferase, putative [Plasmodium malariae]SCO93102.1 choline/ethanolaminephosphotransferase, putative [Plasmodium malariae]
MGIFLKLHKSVYANCKSYVYKSSGHSILDNLFDAYWNLCVKLIPKSVTANMLTLIAFLCSTIAFLIMYLFDISNKKNDYIFLYISFFLFMYQTLDALDGKQARRTNTSSPLGQLFDHGCDSITSSLFVFIGGKVTCLPKGLCFFTWIEHYTKVYNTSLGSIGVTESDIFVREINNIIALCVVRGIKGAAIYESATLKDILPGTVTFLGKTVINIRLLTILSVIVYFFLIRSLIRSLYMGVKTAKKKKKEAALQLLTYFLFILVQYYFYESTLTKKNELLFFTIVGLYSAFYTLHMNLSNILKIKMDYFPLPIMVYYFFIAFLFVKRRTNHHLLDYAVFNENHILYYMLIFGTLYLFDYAYTVITNICKELNITFLFNKKKKK